MRLNNVQTASRVFTTSVSPSDDAPAPKAVDAPSSRACSPQEEHDEDASMRWVATFCVGGASIERDVMARSQLVAAENVAREKHGILPPIFMKPEKPRETAASLHRPRETALQFPRLRAVERAVLVGTVGMVGTAITALVSIQNLSTRGSSRSRRDAEGVYNAITFAFPHVFYPPKIYPAGNRQSLRRAARMMLPLEDASWASSASRSSVA